MIWPFSRIFPTRDQAALAVREAVTPNSADIPENESLWRSLMRKKRDLIEVDHSRQLEIAAWLRLHNSFAKRYEEIITDFTAGEEPAPQADDERLQELLDAYWDDPVNDMRHFARELAGQLGSLGEQFVTAHIRKTDGRLRHGYIDPADVAAVVSDPENSRDLIEVHTRGDTGAEGNVYRIVRPNEPIEDLFTSIGSLKIVPRPPELVRSQELRQSKPTYDGLVFVFGVNRLSNATRGVSDYFSVADYLDGMDRAVFNSVERAYLLNTLAWHLTVKGASDRKALEEQRDIAIACVKKPGGLYASNDNITLEPHVADLKAADMAELVRIVKLVILAGWGFPEHWFAEGGETNLATAGEMGGPTIRKLSSRQTLVRQMLRTLASFQVRLKEAIAPESVRGIEDIDAFEVMLPEITGKDTVRESQTLAQTTTTITLAEDAEYLTKESAARMWQQQASAILGYEFTDADRALLERHAEEDEQRLEEPEEPESPAFDDGLEPEEDSFETNQKKPLPPEMKAQADKLKKATEEKVA